MGKASFYANSMKSAYNELYAKHSALAAEIAEAEAKINKVRNDKDLTAAAKSNKQAELRAEIIRKENQIADIQKEAAQRFAKIRNEARQDYPEYRLDPDSIDHDMMTLIDSGIASASEIAEIIESKGYARNNATMCRLLSAKLRKIADEKEGRMDEAERQRISSLAIRLSDIQNPIDNMLNRFATTAEMALRPDVLLATGIHESMMPEQFSAIDAAAAAIDSGE